MTTLKEALLLSLHDNYPEWSFGGFLKEHWEDSIQRDPNGPTICLTDMLSNLAEGSERFFENPIRTARLTLTCYVTPLEVREALWLASIFGELAYPNVLRDWNLAIAYMLSPHSSVRHAAARVVESSGRDFFSNPLRQTDLRRCFAEQLQTNIYLADVLKMDCELTPGDKNKVQAWWQPDDDKPPRRTWTNKVWCKAEEDHCNSCLVCMASLELSHLLPPPPPPVPLPPPDDFLAALPLKVSTPLIKAGYNTEAKVRKLSREKFLEIPNLGKASYSLVQLRLKQK